MKKILLMFCVFLALQSACFAKTGVSFIYINGSNNNDEKMKNWFVNGVYKLHPSLRSEFYKSPDAQLYFLENNTLSIETQPKVFFWGDRSRHDLDFVTQNIAISKGFSPWLAYQVRYFFATCMHDAIWVQKYHNMRPILANLHRSVMEEHQEGKKVVLYGYSAGSFITYEYLLNKLPYINLKEFFNKVDISQEEKDFVAANPRKNTCMDALIDSKLTVLSMTGHLVPNINKELFKQNYINIDEATSTECIPEGAVRGIVNFASPLVLFYSDLADPEYELNYYTALMFKYLIEKDLFWLTVNYREDPLGFPTSRNLTIEQIEERSGMKMYPHEGFMYDQSDVWSKRTFAGAHTSYWNTNKTLAKAIVKAYVEGYRFQYDKAFQKEMLEKMKRPEDI